MPEQREHGIAWCTTTWNPLRGCSKVSAGCKHCYAEAVAARFSGPGQPYEGTIERGRWNGKVRLVPEHLADPLRWTRPRLVFVNSMSDLFHEDVPFEYVAAVFGVMAASPRHTFQVLTKRPERALEWFRELPTWGGRQPKDLALADYCMEFARGYFADARAKGGYGMTSWPLPNVHLGVSAEDQETADERIPLLLQCPAAVRWVSYEPALGPVDFEPWLPADDPIATIGGGEFDPRSLDSVLAYITGGPVAATGIVGRPLALDWIVIGGESGPGARPFDIEWLETTVRACKAAGVHVFVKQDSGPKPGQRGRIPDHLWIKEWPDAVQGSGEGA